MFNIFKKKNIVIEKYRFKRIFLIILDGVGIGETYDAEIYDDINANTLKHTLECTTHQYKNLAKFGLFNLLNNTNLNTLSYYCKANPLVSGKDSYMSHYEMMGIDLSNYLNILQNGLPDKIIKDIEYKIKKNVLVFNSRKGNTIEDLRIIHLKDKNSIILQISNESVLYISAHESIIPVNELYNICMLIKDITIKNNYRIGRIIAKPFNGNTNEFHYTNNYKIFSLEINEQTILDKLKNNKYDVISIGKISNIFNNKGITLEAKTNNNTDGIRRIMDAERKEFTGLCIANLSDFDEIYGHNRNAVGFSNALREFDEALPHFMTHINDDDLFIITADHGNDPTFKGNDNTREKTPVFIYSPQFKEPKRLDELKTFADIGATIADNFKIEKIKIGNSLMNKLK